MPGPSPPLVSAVPIYSSSFLRQGIGDFSSKRLLTDRMFSSEQSVHCDLLHAFSAIFMCFLSVTHDQSYAYSLFPSSRKCNGDRHTHSEEEVVG